MSHSPPPNPGKNLSGFFVFLLNRFDFQVKIVDNPYTQVTTTSDKHNSHERRNNDDTTS